MMKILIALISCLLTLVLSTPLSALTLTGKYFTVTESDCNMELLLGEDGLGKAIQTCRLEDGSHRNATNATLIKWKQENDNVIVTTLREENIFTYKPSVSCEEYGAKGYSAALILETKGNHLFSGYNSSYWKVPSNCKLITEE
jgi:hypothetical protein